MLRRRKVSNIFSGVAGRGGAHHAVVEGGAAIDLDREHRHHHTGTRHWIHLAAVGGVVTSGCDTGLFNSSWPPNEASADAGTLLNLKLQCAQGATADGVASYA